MIKFEKEIREAIATAQSLGWTIRSNWAPIDPITRRCCALGALGVGKQYETFVPAALENGIDNNWAWSFVGGFDGADYIGKMLNGIQIPEATELGAQLRKELL